MAWDDFLKVDSLGILGTNASLKLKQSLFHEHFFKKRNPKIRPKMLKTKDFDWNREKKNKKRKLHDLFQSSCWNGSPHGCDRRRHSLTLSSQQTLPCIALHTQINLI